MSLDDFEKEKEHQENVDFVVKYGIDITTLDPEDNPADEELIPPAEKGVSQSENIKDTL